MTRYLIGFAGAPDSESPVSSNVAMAFNGPDEEVLPRMLRLIKEGPAICWQVTQESPFGHGR